MQLSGVGATTATCLLAMIGNGHEFDCGRQFAAWLGLAPGQYSSGGKTRLGRITKAGDGYLRSLLVLGAGPCWRRPRTRPTRSADGLWPWLSAGATGRPWWPSRRRTRAWPGRCCAKARTLRCQPELASIAQRQPTTTTRSTRIRPPHTADVTASVDDNRFGPARGVTD